MASLAVRSCLAITRVLVCLVLCIASELVRADTELLKDPAFQSGYEVMSPLKDIYTNHAEREAIHHELSIPVEKPGWRLVQWGSGKSIANAKPITIPDGGTTWTADELKEGKSVVYKRVTTGLNYPSPEQPLSRSLILELNGLAEFTHPFYTMSEQGKNKTSPYLTSNTEFWPHLLMVQNIYAQKMDRYHSINFRMDARLLFDNKNIQAGYQEGLHAARYPVGFLIKNSLTGNSFWLMFVVYDDRYEQSGYSCQKCNDKLLRDCHQPLSIIEKGKWLCSYDGGRIELPLKANAKDKKVGTRKMIFRAPTSAFTQNDIRSGQWAHYQVDLLPYIQAGIDAMHDQQSLSSGKKAGLSTSLKFYNLSLFTMGWEITGLNHAAMEVKNLNLVGN